MPTSFRSNMADEDSLRLWCWCCPPTTTQTQWTSRGRKSISSSTPFRLPAYPSFTEVAWGPIESFSGSRRSSDHDAGHCWSPTDRRIRGVMEPPVRCSLADEYLRQNSEQRSEDFNRRGSLGASYVNVSQEPSKHVIA